MLRERLLTMWVTPPRLTLGAADRSPLRPTWCVSWNFEFDPTADPPPAGRCPAEALFDAVMASTGNASSTARLR